MHVSLDGFVGGPKGELDWVHVDKDIFNYTGALTTEADIALYGRVTYDMMEAYWPTAANKPDASPHDIQHSDWYNKTEKVVISKSLKGKTLSNTRIISDNIAEEVSHLKEGTGKNILIFGSPSAAQTLMLENLIDDYWLFVNPVLLGQGIPLFKNIKEKIKLKLAFEHAFSSGVVCLHYQTIH